MPGVGKNAGPAPGWRRIEAQARLFHRLPRRRVKRFVAGFQDPGRTSRGGAATEASRILPNGAGRWIQWRSRPRAGALPGKRAPPSRPGQWGSSDVVQIPRRSGAVREKRRSACGASGGGRPRPTARRVDFASFDLHDPTKFGLRARSGHLADQRAGDGNAGSIGSAPEHDRSRNSPEDNGRLDDPRHSVPPVDVVAAGEDAEQAGARTMGASPPESPRRPLVRSRMFPGCAPTASASPRVLFHASCGRSRVEKIVLNVQRGDAAVSAQDAGAAIRPAYMTS